MLARSQEHFDIMAFHETRLNSNITSLFHLPGYNNNSYTQCRNTEGGGVALYIYILFTIPVDYIYSIIVLYGKLLRMCCCWGSMS